MDVQHFLSLSDFQPARLDALLARALELKAEHRAGGAAPLLAGKVLAMVFDKNSTRTRVSFEAGMAQLGGSALFLTPDATQQSRGEPVEDAARVLSSMVDAILVRTFAHETLERYAEASAVPVINGLTDRLHPCQLLADMLTYRELRGAIAGAPVAFVGDGNNMCRSYIEAAAQFGFELRVATPPGYAPEPEWLKRGGDRARWCEDPREAVTDAMLVATDVWASMGQEEERRERLRAFRGYQVDAALLAAAAPEALFMHCLPAHRGEEVAAEVLDGPQSVVWQEAENRLHAQKALLLELLDGSDRNRA